MDLSGWRTVPSEEGRLECADPVLFMRDCSYRTMAPQFRRSVKAHRKRKLVSSESTPPAQAGEAKEVVKDPYQANEERMV